jgi:hypothetical protein
LSERDILLLVGAALAAAALGWWYRRGRKSPEERERLRRMYLHSRGRLADGKLVDLLERDGRRLVSYEYSVSQVTYSASQDISALRGVFGIEGHCEGLPTRVKYDPQNPVDSIVVCEVWNGLD